MKKSTKGAIAAVAGATVLLGGVGSLAYWNATATVGGATINSGTMTLTDTTSGTCAATPFTLNANTAAAAGASQPSAPFTPSSGTIVPGDTLTKVCTYTINAIGTHLAATIAVTGGGASGTLASSVTAAGTYTVNGAAATTITNANNGQTLQATITLTFPYGTAVDNTSQTKTLSLADYAVTLTQVHS
jgi:alternate signal-mediated exported protein